MSPRCTLVVEAPQPHTQMRIVYTCIPAQRGRERRRCPGSRATLFLAPGAIDLKRPHHHLSPVVRSVMARPRSSRSRRVVHASPSGASRRGCPTTGKSVSQPDCIMYSTQDIATMYTETRRTHLEIAGFAAIGVGVGGAQVSSEFRMEERRATLGQNAV
jgi:hypothetical protein